MVKASVYLFEEITPTNFLRKNDKQMQDMPLFNGDDFVVVI